MVTQDLGLISHPNILSFIGVTLTNEIAVVSRLVEAGIVLKYLGSAEGP